MNEQFVSCTEAHIRGNKWLLAPRPCCCQPGYFPGLGLYLREGLLIIYIYIYKFLNDYICILCQALFCTLLILSYSTLITVYFTDERPETLREVKLPCLGPSSLLSQVLESSPNSVAHSLGSESPVL